MRLGIIVIKKIARFDFSCPALPDRQATGGRPNPPFYPGFYQEPNFKWFGEAQTNLADIIYYQV
jgi:hypothetical protein